MAEGKINFTESQDKSGKKPHFKGFITIADQVHEFAVWPAKTGNGWSGTYKPKGQQYVKPETVAPETRETLDKMYQAVQQPLDDEIPF